MSDPLTLDALRVPVVHRHTHYDTGEHLGDEIEWVPVTPDMLIEVLEGMGAKRVWWCEYEATGWGESEPTCDGLHSGYPSQCGWALVLPLPTPQEADDAE